MRLNGGEVDFAVRLPHIDLSRTNELIEIVFRAEVFKFGTHFAGRIYDSVRPGEERARRTVSLVY